MSNEQSLAVIEQREVDFYDDRVIAVRVTDGTVYVPIRPICERIGVTWTGQRRRINRDPVLSPKMTPVNVTFTGHTHGHEQGVEMLCLPLKFIPGFLFGINADRVKPEIRDRLIRYQEECYEVLDQAFQAGRLTYHDQIMTAQTPAARAYQIAMALADLARQQWVIEQRIDIAETQIGDHAQRLELIEAQLGNPERFITESQAMQISQGVRAIAFELGKRSGRNEYQGVYGELYRRYEITSYKRMPVAKFDGAMEWLREWYGALVDVEDLPF